MSRYRTSATRMKPGQSGYLLGPAGRVSRFRPSAAGGRLIGPKHFRVGLGQDPESTLPPPYSWLSDWWSGTPDETPAPASGETPGPAPINPLDAIQRWNALSESERAERVNALRAGVVSLPEETSREEYETLMESTAAGWKALKSETDQLTAALVKHWDDLDTPGLRAVLDSRSTDRWAYWSDMGFDQDEAAIEDANNVLDQVQLAVGQWSLHFNEEPYYEQQRFGMGAIFATMLIIGGIILLVGGAVAVGIFLYWLHDFLMGESELMKERKRVALEKISAVIDASDMTDAEKGALKRETESLLNTTASVPATIAWTAVAVLLTLAGVWLWPRGAAVATKAKGARLSVAWGGNDEDEEEDEPLVAVASSPARAPAPAPAAESAWGGAVGAGAGGGGGSIYS